MTRFVGGASHQTGQYAGRADGLSFNAGFSNLGGISIDSNGILYVIDNGNHLIRKVTTSGEIKF